MKPCGVGVAGARLHAVTCLRMQDMLDVLAKHNHSMAWHALIFWMAPFHLTQQSKPHICLHGTLMVACCKDCSFGWLMAKETIILGLMGMRMQGWWY